MPYAMEFRAAVARHYDECGSSVETAEVFGCSESWVRRLIQRRREDGSLKTRPSTRIYHSKIDDAELQRLAKLIQEKPDMTLGELAEALGNNPSIPTVWRATRKLGLRLKKRPSTPPSRIART